MTSDSTSWPKEAYEPVEVHLDAVEEVLFETGATRRERRAILDELQGQINEMLADRFGDEVTVEQVQRLVDELEPPHKYAGAVEPRIKRTKRAEPRLSRWAIAGTVLAVAPFFIYGLAILFGDASLLLVPLLSLLCLTVLLAVVGSPFCGVRALLQIDCRPAIYYGRPLAITLFVLPVMATGNALVLVIASAGGEASLYLLCLVAFIFLNVWAFPFVIRLLKWTTAAAAGSSGRRSSASVSALAT